MFRLSVIRMLISWLESDIETEIAVFPVSLWDSLFSVNLRVYRPFLILIFIVALLHVGKGLVIALVLTRSL